MPGGSPVRAVLFDYGNVLVRWDPPRLYSRLFDDPAETAHFLSAVCPPEWHHLHDCGRPMAESVPARIAEHPRYSEAIRAWDERFGEMLGGEIPGIGDLIDRLTARGVPLGLLSNMPAEKVETCLGFYSRRSAFRSITISGEIGIAKPDRRAFEIALEALGATAEETLFVDDLLPNIEGAAQAGLQTHQFEAAEGLEAALARAGLLD